MVECVLRISCRSGGSNIFGALHHRPSLSDIDAWQWPGLNMTEALYYFKKSENHPLAGDSPFHGGDGRAAHSQRTFNHSRRLNHTTTTTTTTSRPHPDPHRQRRGCALRAGPPDPGRSQPGLPHARGHGERLQHVPWRPHDACSDLPPQIAWLTAACRIGVGTVNRAMANGRRLSSYDIWLPEV